jgi:hypothetical protein
MQTMAYRFVSRSATVLVTLFSLSFPAYGQHTPPPSVVPQIKPLVKLVGYVNATPAPTNVQPVVTFKLPGNKKPFTFLVTEMKVMAGPLRTAESILAEVKPYTPNFRIRTSREIAAQLAETPPTERLTILAEYSQSDRALLIQSVQREEQASL